MPKDNHRRNKLEPMHQFGVFVGIVPRTGEFVVLTPGGAALVRTAHRLSEDRRWDAEFISEVRGAPWDFKSSAGEGIEKGDPLPLDPAVDLPPRMRTRRMYIRRMEVEKCGPTRGCSGCQKVMSGAVPSCIVATHSDECIERMEKFMMQDFEGADRVVRRKLVLTMRSQGTSKSTTREQRRLRNTTITKQVQTRIRHHHRHQVVWSDHQRSNNETVRTMRK